MRLMYKSKEAAMRRIIGSRGAYRSDGGRLCTSLLANGIMEIVLFG